MSDEQSKSALAPLDNARRMLAEATTIQDIMRVANLAQRAADFAKAARLGLAVSNQAKEIELLARRKAGETLLELKRAGEIKEGKPERDGKLYQRGTVTLGDLGLSRNESSRLQREASITRSVFDEYVRETISQDLELSSAGLRKFGDPGKADADRRALEEIDRGMEEARRKWQKKQEANERALREPQFVSDEPVDVRDPVAPCSTPDFAQAVLALHEELQQSDEEVSISRVRDLVEALWRAVWNDGADPWIDPED